MAERPSTRAGGAHPATTPPGFPRTVLRRWRAIPWVNRATSCSKAGRPVGLEAARAPVVSIHELGTLGGAVSQAKAVNRAGQVVGTSRDALGRTRAFLWQEDLGIVDLQPLTGVNTSANDISDRGEIV